jgi:hypothetical protein
VLWLKENWQDLLFPMMYFTGNNYYPFLFQWAENAYGHPICPGLGIYFLDPREGKWTLNEVRAEMHTARNSGIGGMAFYRGEFLTKNYKGIYDTACDEFFPYPALTARMTWTGDTLAPSAPAAIKYEEGTLQWKPSLPLRPSQHILYNVYGSNTYPVDVTKAENLLATRVRTNQWTVNARGMRMRYYAVTAMDRMGNESLAAQEEKPSIELPEHINVTRLINRDMAKKGKSTRKKK